jgi:hypothetical protein
MKPKTKYYIGQKFNFLTILSLDHIDNRGRKFFKCKCDCGKEKIIQGSLMSSGNTKSCGCYGMKVRKDKRISTNHSEITAIILGYKRHAKGRGFQFLLSRQQVESIIIQPCHYCQSPPSNLMHTKNSIDNGMLYNGIDRVDSKKDYTIDNVVSCCKICNNAKSDLTLNEFIEWIKRVYNKAMAEQWG